MASWSDDFNRADESPLGAPWVQQAIMTTSRTVDLVSNRVTRGGSGAGESSAYYGDATFGPDVIVEADYESGAGNPLYLIARLASPGDSATGYLAECIPGGLSRLWRMDSGYDTMTAIGSVSGAGSSPGRWGLRCVGSTITLEFDGVEVASGTDSTYADAGYAGLGGLVFSDADNFSVADLAAPPAAIAARIIRSPIRVW